MSTEFIEDTYSNAIYLLSTVRSAARLKYNMHTFPTLPVELVYRIMDHQNDRTLFCSMQNICRRLNQILSTYQRYQILDTALLSETTTSMIIHPKNSHLHPTPPSKSTPHITISNHIHTIRSAIKGFLYYFRFSLHTTSIQTLTTLNLYYNKIGAEGAQHLANALRTNTTLTTLDLSCNRIGAEGAQHLANALRTNTTLTTLDLYKNEIGAEGAQHIADSLRTNATLTTHNLSSNQIGDEGAKHVADALRTNTTLTTLALTWNQIGVEGAKHIADALRTNTTLTTLDLTWNQIGAEGAQHIADALRTNTTLTTFHLHDDEIGDEIAQHIADALGRNI
ncbi:unnamed protein product, partial [Adineta ricciae]